MADADESSEALDEVIALLINTGDLWPAAAVTIPFLAELAGHARSPALRTNLIGWLCGFATHVADDLIEDADYAAVEDRTPAADPNSESAHQAVGVEVQDLLATWPAQPLAVRYRLALLAAIYPDQGRWLRAEIAALADTIPGTRQHVNLGAVLAMLDGRYPDAIALATPTARWEQAFVNMAWLDAPGISDRTRAEHALGRNV